jgi:GTP:adenosylcobinamide-phosphate guanylyltransferase
MAGGLGKRMKTLKSKPLLFFHGQPLIKWVFSAVIGCPYIANIFVAITKDMDKIKEVTDVKFIFTPGGGYVNDLVFAIQEQRLKKTLIISADLPLITSPDLDWVVEEYNKLTTPALAVFVPKKIYQNLDLKPTIEMDGFVPAGVNVVDGENLDGKETRLISTNPSFAFNINTPEDLEKALIYSNKS